jgi:hypothetical protein
VLRIAGGNDTVVIENYLRNPLARVETLLFADGSSLPDAETIVEQQTAIRGTPGADSISGTAYSDRLYGLDGNDTLLGGADDDTLNGDSGADSLAGGPGTDLLAGGTGFDRYQFNAGDGSDTVVDPDADSVVLFGAGIAPQSVITTRSGDDLLLTVSATADRVSIPAYFIGYPVAEFRFSNGTAWTVDTIKTKVITPTSGPDTLIGFESNDSIAGLAGADALYGRGGNDTLDGGLGSDALFGEDGNDTLVGGTGEAKSANVADTLFGGNGDDVLIGGGNAASAERLDGGPGTDLLIGGAAQEIIDDTGYDGRNSLLYGGAGVDIIRMYGGASAMAIGGAANDRISGGLAAGVSKTRMIVAFNKSDGIETVDQLAAGSTITVGGALYSNLSLEVSGSGLRLKTSSSDYVYLSDWYSGGKAVSTLQVIVDGTKDYKPTSSNPLNNTKIVAFDFAGLVMAFDAARAAGQQFSVANNLATYRLWGSDTAAIGGAISYQYAKTGSLGTLTHDQMRTILSAPGFGASAQPIAPGAGAMAATEAPGAASVFQPPAAPALVTPSERESPSALAPAHPASDVISREPNLLVTLERFSANRWAQPETLGAQDTHASAYASGWRRIARELPTYLGNSDGFASSAKYQTPHFPAGLSGSSLPYVAAVGLIDTGRHDLRPFEGLKEGFASIGDR